MNADPVTLNDSASLADWLHNLESRHPQEIHLGLTRIFEVAKCLSLLQPKAKVITIAGTNGKGSTVALLEQIYINAGYRVASYTSPHVLQFNERIRIHGLALSDAQIVSAFCAIEQVREDVFLSYFEMVTLAALYCFKQQALDIIILEVGLGGRLDATNIITPDLSVITSIDYDHQAWLGDTLEAIAGEKAGILRPNVPFVYGSSVRFCAIDNKAQQLQCPRFYRGIDFDFDNDKKNYQIRNKHITLSKTPFLQAQAIASALMAVDVLQDSFPVKDSVLINACENTQLLGRQQSIKSDKLLLLDVAHNKQSVASLAEKIRAYGLPKPSVHFVFSALSDKDFTGFLEPMMSLSSSWYISALCCARSAKVTTLYDSIVQLGGQNVKIYATIEEAFNKAWQSVKKDELVVVFGSFFTVSEVLSCALYKKILEK